MREFINPFFLYANKEICVVTKAKVASRFVATIFDYSNNHNSDNQYIYLDEYGANYNNNDLAFKTYNDIFENGDSSRDVYIFYRNPINRYHSGVIQDLIRIFDGDTLTNAYYLNGSIKKFNLNPFEMAYNFSTNNYDFLMRNKKYLPFLKSLIRDFIEWQIKFKVITTDHTEPYIDILYNISQNIQSDKLFFVNIDDEKNDLVKIFKKYKSLTIPTSVKMDKSVISHSNFFETVDDVFKEKQEYLTFRGEFLESEYKYYDLLESHSRNVLNLE